MAYYSVREVGLVKSDLWLPSVVKDLHKFKNEVEALRYLSENGYKEAQSSKGTIYTKTEDDYETYTQYRAKIVKTSDFYKTENVILFDEWLLSTIR